MTFFSGTDTDTLLNEGSERNNFVSLIVNNKGIYTAAITRKMTVNQKVVEKSCYTLFNEDAVCSEDNFTVDETTVQYFMLNINIESTKNDIAEWAKRVDYIKDSKKAVKINETPTSIFPKTNQNSSFHTQEKDLFSDIHNDFWYDDSDLYSPYLHLKEKTIDDLIQQMLTCDVIIKDFKILPWLTTMDKTLDKRFGTGESGVKAYKDYMNGFLDFLLFNIEDPLMDKGYDFDTISQVCVSDIIEKLESYPHTKYGDILIKLLKDYL